MNCNNLSYDNRETCTVSVPTSCSPYTGYLSSVLFPNQPEQPCRPNANDIFKVIQEAIDAITAKLGDNTTLNNNCLSFDPETATQAEINQAIITQLCLLKTSVESLGGAIDPDSIMLAVDLLCLQDPSCDPQVSYSLLTIINKLLTAVCNHENRIAAIETILNI